MGVLSLFKWREWISFWDDALHLLSAVSMKPTLKVCDVGKSVVVTRVAQG